jgi:hypothetical protein
MLSKNVTLVVGGLGHFGGKISLHLFEDSQTNVLILEKKERIQDAYVAGDLEKNGISLDSLLAFEDGLFFQFNGESFVTFKKPQVTKVIFAIRHRSPNLSPEQVTSILDESPLRDSLEKVVLFPLELLRNLEFDSQSDQDRRVILIYSSNANFISHQSMAYHVTNSAVAHLFKFLALTLYEFDIKVFLIEVGVLDSTGGLVGKDKSNKFAPSSTNELFDLLDYFLFVSGYGLVGKPVALTGVRNLLDSTAVSEGVFGNLSVRTNI